MLIASIYKDNSIRTARVFSPDIDEQEAMNYWMAMGNHCYVFTVDGEIAGTYIIKANQPGLGGHVANASFMVHPGYRRRKIGFKMGEHALKEAKQLGFHAMQFNIVIATNTAAVNLWKSLGFEIIGTTPKAFQQQKLGLVDAHIMHRFL